MSSRGYRSRVRRATRCATASKRVRSISKCGDCPELTAAAMAAQRSRTVAGERKLRTASCNAPKSVASFKAAPLHGSEHHFIRHAAVGEIARRDLGLDLHACICRHQVVGDLHAFADLDAAAGDRVEL